MQTLEIPRDQWQPFLDEFSRRHLREPVTIEVIAKGTGDTVEGSDLPLLGVTADKKDSLGELIEIIAGDSPDANVNRIVHQPSCVRVARDEAGSDQALEIESITEPKILLRFGSTPFPPQYGA